MTEYMFEGDRIKLIPKHYNRMLKAYPNLNLRKELEQLDIELMEATDKTWFMTLNAKLNYRNKSSVKLKCSQSTRDRSLQEDLDDSSWAE